MLSVVPDQRPTASQVAASLRDLGSKYAPPALAGPGEGKGNWLSGDCPEREPSSLTDDRENSRSASGCDRLQDQSLRLPDNLMENNADSDHEREHEHEHAPAAVSTRTTAPVTALGRGARPGGPPSNEAKRRSEQSPNPKAAAEGSGRRGGGGGGADGREWGRGGGDAAELEFDFARVPQDDGPDGDDADDGDDGELGASDLLADFVVSGRSRTRGPSASAHEVHLLDRLPIASSSAGRAAASGGGVHAPPLAAAAGNAPSASGVPSLSVTVQELAHAAGRVVAALLGLKLEAHERRRRLLRRKHAAIVGQPEFRP